MDVAVTRLLKDTDPSPLSVHLPRRDRVRHVSFYYVRIDIRDFDRTLGISAGQIRFGDGVASTDGVGHDNNERILAPGANPGARVGKI